MKICINESESLAEALESSCDCHGCETMIEDAIADDFRRKIRGY